MKYVTLNNGVRMPQLGYGVFQIPAEACEACVRDALALGYRLIDTAPVYGNEAAVGAAIKHAGIPREEVFLTTKLWVQDTSYEGAKRAAKASMERLGVDYLDLYLIHHPIGDYYGAWQAMEEMYRDGMIQAIGVCNFDEARLVDLCMNHTVIPAVNQVEIHPFHQQVSAIQTMKRYHVHPQAWGPFSEGQRDIFHHPLLCEIAAHHGKSTAQVLLRWNLQQGNIVIPKTVHRERMAENLDGWDFVLDSEEMEAVRTLDIGHSEIINHYSPCTAKVLNMTKILSAEDGPDCTLTDQF